MINEGMIDCVNRYSSNLASNNKRVDLFDGPAEDHMEENVLLASSNALFNSIFLSFKDLAKTTNTAIDMCIN